MLTKFRKMNLGPGKCSRASNNMEALKTETDIKDFLDELCDTYVPKEMREQRKDFGIVYTYQFIVLFSQQMDPTEVTFN